MRLMLGVAAALVVAGTAAADKAEDVIKKAIQAHGGADVLNKYTAAKVHVKGEMNVQGTDVPFEADMAYAPGKFRMVLQMEAMGQKATFTQVLNGDKGKRTVKVGDQVVQAADMDKDEIKQSLAGRQAQRLTPLLDPKLFTLKAADDEDVNGKKAAVVLATPKGLDKEMKLYFDKSSGLLVKSAHKGKAPGSAADRPEVLQESFVSDYKKVNGLQVAGKVEVHHDGKKAMTGTLSDHKVLDKIDDKEFAVED